ncbi:MAG: hypothetical protein ACREAA_18845 [Candidatus Polarisedimenticolia bacterium]
MTHLAWKIRGRIRAYQYRVDMMRRHGELTHLEEAILFLLLATALGLLAVRW